MSYNIRYGSAEDESNSWTNRRPATIAMINDQLPDIFGVQEAESDQLEYVTANCTDYSMVGVGRDDGVSTGEHMSVFWNTKTMKMLDWGTFWLSDTPDKPSGTWGSSIRRSTTWTLVQHRESGKKLYFVNTHLHHKVNEYEAQKKGLELIKERIAQMNTSGYPVVLTGDFNIQPGHAALDVLDGVMLSAREEAQKTSNLNTYNAFKSTGGEILDYIYYSGFSGCLEFQTVTNTYLDIPYISDHYPVMSRLVF